MQLRVCVVLALLLGAASNAGAQAEKPVPKEVAPGEDDQMYSCKKASHPVAVTFKPETEIRDLITWAMSFTCKSFLLDPRVVVTGRKVTLIVPTQLSPADAYRVFLAALSTAGLTVVPKGNIIKIVDAASAKKDTVPLIRKGLPDDIDQFVRYVYRPSYVQAETIRAAFTAMKSEPGDVVLVSSLVVITDYGSNVRDMMSLAKLIDVAGGTDGVYTIPLRHADVTKLAPKLEAFLGVSAPAAAPRAPRPDGVPAPATEVATAVPSKIMIDERTNTLVVASSEAAYLRLKAIVERLDIALEIEGGATFHVHPLGHAVADELATTLNAAISGQAQKPAAAASGPQRPPAPAPTTPEAGSALEGPVRVIGEKATNSLIVMSSGRDFLAIRDIIRQLDLPRRQVFIEAMILEVAVGNDHTLGAIGHTGAPGAANTSLAFAGTQMPVGQSTVSTLTTDTLKTSAASMTGLVAGLVGPVIKTSLGLSIPSYAVLFQALATSSNANILSTPSIIAIDNEESKYKVGTQVPILKGLNFATGSTDAPLGSVGQNISMEDVLLELSIKPHISKDETIMLEVKHDARDLVTQGSLGPTFSKRSFDTRVVVRDQQTVVIGGLMQERATLEETKVPILGDIPLLGYLFKRQITVKKKTNLLVMLTPYIIKDQLDLQAVRERKLRDHEEFSGSLAALRSMQYTPKMDYRRKRGLVEEINRVVQDIDTETEARKALRTPPSVAPGRIDYKPEEN